MELGLRSRLRLGLGFDGGGGGSSSSSWVWVGVVLIVEVVSGFAVLLWLCSSLWFGVKLVGFVVSVVL